MSGCGPVYKLMSRCGPLIQSGVCKCGGISIEQGVTKEREVP